MWFPEFSGTSELMPACPLRHIRLYAEKPTALRVGRSVSVLRWEADRLFMKPDAKRLIFTNEV